ncbi:MAG: oligosaccharide biosynthesis protein Alg14 like-domain-containing protein [Linnemannia gamsii]|nr:MAG: oligosaccharide biosynthesis protein Alg14 like-domain-containing protein [Linnemannia gamsii]
MDRHQLFNLVLASVSTAVLVGIPLAMMLASRLWLSLPQNRPRNKNHPTNASRSKACTTTIFLGSGGHTAEMLQLVSGLDGTHYTPRHYVVGSDDNSSVEKVHRLEASMAVRRANTEETRAGRDIDAAGYPTTNTDVSSEYTVHRIPRSRHVHQTMLTTPFTLIKSLYVAMPLIKQLTCLTKSETLSTTGLLTEAPGHVRRSVLLMNGPGTCLALALAVIGARMAGVPDELTPDLVFLESFARVKTLSLAGRLLYPLCDAFVVQWPGLVQQYPRAKYIGTLV